MFHAVVLDRAFLFLYAHLLSLRRVAAGFLGLRKTAMRPFGYAQLRCDALAGQCRNAGLPKFDVEEGAVVVREAYFRHLA